VLLAPRQAAAGCCLRQVAPTRVHLLVLLLLWQQQQKQGGLHRSVAPRKLDPRRWETKVPLAAAAESRRWGPLPPQKGVRQALHPGQALPLLHRRQMLAQTQRAVCPQPPQQQQRGTPLRQGAGRASAAWAPLPLPLAPLPLRCPHSHQQPLLPC
jgi:hypothetical protein